MSLHARSLQAHAGWVLRSLHARSLQAHAGWVLRSSPSLFFPSHLSLYFLFTHLRHSLLTGQGRYSHVEKLQLQAIERAHSQEPTLTTSNRLQCQLSDDQTQMPRSIRISTPWDADQMALSEKPCLSVFLKGNCPSVPNLRTDSVTRWCPHVDRQHGHMTGPPGTDLPRWRTSSSPRHSGRSLKPHQDLTNT